MAAKRKGKTKHEKEHLNRVAELGCIVCYRQGNAGTPAEIHHLRTGRGIAQRSSHLRVIPLCPIHHRTGGYGENGFHQSPKDFQERYGTELELLEVVNGYLGIETKTNGED